MSASGGLSAIGAVHQRRRWWCVVDASVWVSRLVPADVHHVASRRWLQQHFTAGNVVVAPTLLLVEIAGAIARRTGDTRRTRHLVRLMRQLSGIRWVGLTGTVRDHAADVAATLHLRGADAVYVALADRLKIPLITWDSEQLTRTATQTTVSTP
jgi:predicted nucleic acid-binding protein